MTPRRFAATALLASAAFVSNGKAASGDPRETAWNLARAAIQQTGFRPGIPDFLNWAIALEIFPCGIPKPGHSGERDLFDESFHYNGAAAARLCAPLTKAAGAPPLDGALAFWTRSRPRTAVIDPPFPDGASLAAAFWNVVRRPTDPAMGKIVEMPVRLGAQTVTRKIRLTIPSGPNAGASLCPPPSGEGQPVAPGIKDVSIENFYWIRLRPGERYNGASCGDFVVLVAFHLVHKVNGRWLWTTFWWDPESNEFAARRPRDFAGAGENPRAWTKYAMDATYETTGAVFNPWRVEERGDNCARCHKDVTSYRDTTSGEQIFFDSVTAARTHFK